jgi:hypothetical protein
MLPFSQTGNAGSTLSHVVVPAGGRDRVRVQYVNATSDKAASLLTFKVPSASTIVTATIGLALAPGDMVHLMASKAQIPVGAATKEANAATVFVVHEGPALIELDGTTACRINLVAGEYS